MLLRVLITGTWFWKRCGFQIAEMDFMIADVDFMIADVDFMIAYVDLLKCHLIY